MAVSQTQLQQLYLAYFGRPADFDGLVFYTSNPNFDIWSVAAAFSASPESQALYGSGFSASTINAIYQNLFNRDAEPAGLLYWSTEVASGRLTAAGAAYAIFLGAQNEDKITVENKMAVAAAFTAALDTAPEIIGYSGDAAAAAARAFLATVDWTAGSVTAAMAGLEAAVAGVVAIGGPAGQTFTLTTGVDTVVGTNFNDTIVGTINENFDTPQSTLTALDSIDGGAGDDTLVVNDVSGDGVPDGLIVKNVETLLLRSADDAYVDTTTWQGLNTIKVTQAWDTEIIAGATTNVEVTGTDDDIEIDGGANVTVVTDAESGWVDIDGAAGAVSVTHTALGDRWIDIDGGTDVTVVASGASQSWMGWWWWGGWNGADISIGTGGDLEDLPTGAISVTVTGAAVEAGDDLRLGDIYINGGTTVNVQQNATSSSAAAAADTSGATVYQGDVYVNGGANTTAVTVMQSAAVTEVPAVLAVAGTKETNVITFSALADGEDTNIGGLIFTASKDLTAAEVAAAYANLTAGATQGSAPASNGIYSGTLIAGWTSGAVVASGTSFTVTVSSSTVGNKTNLVTDAGTIDMATVATDGTAATTAVAGVLGVVGGEVDVNGAITGADVLATVSLHGFGADSSVTSDALATLDLGHSNQDVTVINASTGATLALTLNAVGIAADHATVDASGAYTTINVGTYGANSVVDLTATAATTLNVGGDKALDITGSTLDALTTVSVSGAASLTMDIDEADTITSFDASGTSGAVTAFIDASKSTYAGGSGVDRLTLTSTTVSKAVAMGAGDDILLLAEGTSALTANLSGGDGVDALVMYAADAQAASATETFETKIDGFERLSVRTVAATTTNTVNLANMDDISFVIVNGTAAVDSVLVLDKMASGGTVLLQNGPHLGTVDVNLTDATGTADSLNVIVRAETSLNAGTVDAAGVEAINLTVADSLTPFSAVHTLSIADTALKSLVITGNAGLTLTTNSVVLTSVDGSAMGGALTATTNGTVAQTILGGSGADTLTGHANGTGDTLNGGAGADTLIVQGDLTTLVGGAGADVFNVGNATTNVNSYATITDLAAGDVIKFSAAAESFAASKVILGDTAVFQDYANAAIALSGDGDVSWFQYAGNTYVIEEVAGGDANLFVNGNDIVVKIVGLVDLSTASFSSSADTLLIV